MYRGAVLPIPRAKTKVHERSEYRPQGRSIRDRRDQGGDAGRGRFGYQGTNMQAAYT